MSYKHFNGVFGKGFSSLGDTLDAFIGNDDRLGKAVRGMEFAVGLEKDNLFAVPANVMYNPTFVGDAKHILGERHNQMVEAMFKTNPERIEIKPTWDSEKDGWWIDFSVRPITDAAPNFIAGQMFSPWNVSYFKRMFREPLTFSNFARMVVKESGTNPWGEVMNLVYEEYAGFANIGGRLSSQHTDDVNAVNGLMSANIINMTVTWSLSLEEIKRSEQGNNPYGRQTMVQKPKYAKYCLDMLSDKIGWYGNAETGTDGILNVNAINMWSGQSFKEIFQDTANTAKGNAIYLQLAGIINNFITRSDGKFKSLKIGMSPECWTYLSSTPYSDVYDPRSAMRIFEENYIKPDKDGIKPSIEWLIDPMLKANLPENPNIFNPFSQDYFVIICSSVGGGPSDISQPLVLYGEPLSEFVYPVVPGVYNTQHKTLKRVAGVFAPVPSAIQVFQGLGVNGTENP